MPIPDYETLMGPLLEIAQAREGNEVAIADVIEQLAGKCKLTEEERREPLPSGSAFKFSSRVSWARTYLQKAGLLETTRRGCFRITKRGLEVLNKKPERVDTRILTQFPEFREFQGGKKKTKKVDTNFFEGEI